MKFLQPLGLLGLIGIPIIIIIYLIKSKYVQKPVSSTFIWKRSLRYVKRKVPLNFILSLLLILQILTVTVASLSIARPMVTPWNSGETIIIIDSSASMLTTDGEKTRFELAKERAAEAADKAGDNSRISIISAGITATELIHRSADKVDIIYALDEFECSYGEADIDGALELASVVQAENRDAKILLYTDKNYETAEGLEVVNFARYEDWNVCVFSVTDKSVASRYVYTAQVVSYGRDAETVVSLFIDGTLYNSKKITLRDSEPVEVIFTPNKNSDAENEVLINSVSSYGNAVVSISAQDGIQYDNEFYLYSKESTNPKVMFISKWITLNSDGNADLSKSTFLLTALRNLGLRIETSDIHKSVNEVTDYTGYDLYVFDGVMPESLPEDGAVWFFDPPSDPIGTTVTLGDTNSGIFYMLPAYNSGSSTYQTLTRNITSRRMALSTYPTLEYGSNYESIFECNGDSVIIAGSEYTTRVVIASFDIHNTNLPSLIDFPLLINNMTKYSLPDVLSKRAYNVGETVDFYAPAGSLTMTFKKDGVILNVMNAHDMQFELDSIGIYEVEVEYQNGNKTSYIMPTHISAAESETNGVGDTVIAQEPPSLSTSRTEPIEAWPYLIVLLLILLVIEWGVYYRDEF